MFTTIYSGALRGVSAYMVSVEVDIDRGLPVFSMVGSLGNEVRESRERVTVALKNCGFDMPPNHITVNFSPGDRKKEGTGYDLPVAVGVLEAMGLLPKNSTDGILFLGELGLSGEIKPVRGVLPIVRAAAEQGIKECIVPMANAKEGAVIPQITVRGAENIRDVHAFLSADSAEKREEILGRILVDTDKIFKEEQISYDLDFSQIKGQESAKRAAEIAAAGFHNLLMVGPPGAGKSMIAKRISGILPPLTLEESLEVTSVASVAGTLHEGEALKVRRPFMSPHHSITQPALIGGGSGMPRPGTISLAHRGVLFLDELPEFQRSVLDSLRQPVEEKKVSICRSGGNISYPSDFMLVCAMNPCPCGFFPDTNKCHCPETKVHQYMGKISGPILDRIDLCTQLEAVKLENLQASAPAESSEKIRKRVVIARERQRERFEGTRYRFNGDIESALVEKFCPLGEAEKRTMEQLYTSLQLSARAYHRILKVSRTIADLAGEGCIRTEHLLEAAYFRPAMDLFG